MATIYHLHVLLYEAMGWDAQVAHLSLILKPEGKGKLSKRDGDKFGFPVFPLTLRILLQVTPLQVTVKKAIYRKLSSIWLPCWDGLLQTIKKL
jgi:hypothetical protein